MNNVESKIYGLDLSLAKAKEKDRLRDSLR